MNRHIITLFLSVGVAAMPAAAQEPNAPKWSVLSVRVKKDSTRNDSIPDSGLGMDLSVALELPGKSIVGVDLVASKCTFIDDKGTDLMKNPRDEPFSRYGLESANLRIPLDRKFGRIWIYAPACPAPGATKARMKGMLVVSIGKDEKAFEKQNVALSLGVELPRGKLAAASAPGGNLTYAGDRPLKSLALFDGDNKDIPFQNNSFYAGLPQPLGNAGKVPYFGVFHLRRRYDRVTIRAVYFENVEKINVPMDFEVSMAL